MNKISGRKINNVSNPSWNFEEYYVAKKNAKHSTGIRHMRRKVTKSSRLFLKNETRNMIKDNL